MKSLPIQRVTYVASWAGAIISHVDHLISVTELVSSKQCQVIHN